MQSQSPEAQVLSERDRKQLSGRRITVGFVLFTTFLLVSMASLIVLLVGQIFDRLTPSLQHDLEWKAKQGVRALAHEVDLGLLTADATLIAEAAKDYAKDADVRAILALDHDRNVLFRLGAEQKDAAEFFRGRERTLRAVDGTLIVWSHVAIESVHVGQVAIAISTERLEAGHRLRRNILAVASAGCLSALIAGLLFVSLYVAPILRITQTTVVRLEQTTMQALEAARLKSEFLANMSHEIRTPMNGVMAMADLLVRTALDVRQMRYAEIIRTSARSLLTVVNDVLDFSKIDAGKYELSPRDFDLRLAVRDAVEMLAPRAQAKGIEIVYRIAPDVPTVLHADGDRFRQVLTNLLGNAVKFTEAGEVVLQVTVAGRRGSELTLHCSIRDTGPGISEDGLSRLFQAFTQVDGSSTRKHGGTGLGLAISKRLAELMGGQIGASSAVGRGSTFWFTIAARAVHSRVTTETITTPQRALVVSESEALRGMLEDYLQRANIHYDGARSIAEGLELLERAIMGETPFDLALVDAKVEGGQGVELVRSIASSNVPIAVALLTDAANVDAHGDGVPSEVTRLSKPVSEAELHDFLVDALHRGEHRALGVQRRGLTPRPELSGRVLAVDDNEINQTVAVELLTELGFSAEVASNGREALEAVQRRDYRAVLMDCQMPVMDGYTAAREIRIWEAAHQKARLPIIALTAHAFAGERDKVIAAGMDDYLTKPIARAQLESSLARYLTRSERASRTTLSPLRVESERARVEETASGGRASAADEMALGPPGAGDPPNPANDVTAPSAALAEEAERAAVLDPNVRRSAKLSQLFLELVPKQLDALSAAIRSDDAAAVRRHAHKLKGSCASLGAAPMATICEELQQAAESGESAAHEASAAALRALFERTARAVRSELAHARVKVG